MNQNTKKHLTRKKDASAPILKYLGIRVKKQNRGIALLTLKVQKKHCNSIGSIHGGVLCDISDAAMGCAFTSLLKKDELGVTVEFKINFLRPVLPGDNIKAHARVISRGNSLYFVESEVRNGKGLLVAKAASTCKVLA